MASHALPLPLLLCLSLFCLSGKSDSTPAAASFIRIKCQTTTYPSVCVQSLSTYARSIQSSPKQLAQAALSVSRNKAQSSRAFVTSLIEQKGLKAREYGALRDCLQEMADSVDRLSKSIQELKKMGQSGGQQRSWHVSNMETWVSAALTDENTCMDGFAFQYMNGKIKAAIRSRMTNVAQVTSNALAFVTQLGGKY